MFRTDSPRILKDCFHLEELFMVDSPPSQRLLRSQGQQDWQRWGRVTTSCLLTLIYRTICCQARGSIIEDW